MQPVGLVVEFALWNTHSLWPEERLLLAVSVTELLEAGIGFFYLGCSHKLDFPRSLCGKK